MTPSEILQLNLNDSSLDLLNAAIASHNVKLEQDDLLLTSTEDESTVTHGKSLLEHVFTNIFVC